MLWHAPQSCLFSRLSNLHFLSLSSHRKCSSPEHLGGPPMNSLLFTVFPILGTPNWAHYLDVIYWVLSRAGITPTLICWLCSCSHCWGCCCPQCCQGTMGSPLLDAPRPQQLFCRAAPSQAGSGWITAKECFPRAGLCTDLNFRSFISSHPSRLSSLLWAAALLSGCHLVPPVWCHLQTWWDCSS